MSYKFINIEPIEDGINIILNRSEKKNSLNAQLVDEISRALKQAEDDNKIKIIILKGKDGYFCTGMDFEEASTLSCQNQQEDFSNLYMNLIKIITSISKVVVASVDGEVMAGGVGIVAACDLVVATPRSRFSLSEALWGIIPAMVMPFLIRKIGYQTAYRMTLTTLPIYAQEAAQVHLIDEVSENTEKSIFRLCSRIRKIESKTVKDIKKYFENMWFIDQDMKNYAVSESARFILSNEVQENIKNFVKYRMFPWEK